jgi:multicomponent K+:H+ antiporter subunit E
MSRWLPNPLVTSILFGAWVVLVTRPSVGHALLGAALAVALPLLTRRFVDRPIRLRRPGAAALLALTVLWDIVVANIDVARLVLGPIGRLRPRFVTVPLDVAHPNAIALLASIITMTPGTVSCDVRVAERRILVHALDVDDPDALVRQIKSRYEQPLGEIFRC